jgi:hypothetical protein
MKRNNIYERKDSPACGSKVGKIQHDNTKHYPNSKETRVLRQIMARTGLSTEEVRQHPKYRKMLSEAQKQGQKPHGNSRYWTGKDEFYKRLIKKACKDTGLVPQHPDTLVVLQCLIDEEWNKRSWYRTTSMLSENPMSAENAVKQYAK